ncbi:MAG: PUA domain-containing protein [Candidatus Woesearchaeota archaeon]
MQKSLSNSEIRVINAKIREAFGIDKSINPKESVVLSGGIVFVNRTALFFEHKHLLAPTLHLLMKNNFLKKAVVDMGAVRFIANGADIMRPGIVETSKFAAGELVSVVDLIHQKPLSVSIALFSSDEIIGLTKGRVLQNIHYVGDRILNATL